MELIIAAIITRMVPKTEVQMTTEAQSFAIEPCSIHDGVAMSDSVNA